MNSRYRDFETFAAAARQLTKLPELDGLLRDFVPSLGLDYFAIADVSGPNAHSHLFQINNYPQAWTETILARDYRKRDPILAASGTTALGFVWSEVSRLIDLTSTQKEILTAAAHSGVGDGFTVPIHIPGETLGIASFCVATGKDFPHSSIPLIHYTGCFVFEFARRLSRQHLKVQPKKLANPKAAALGLADADVMILRYAAEGLVDKMIAQHLNRDPSWIHHRWRSVRSRLGAADRSHAVGIAITLGIIRPPSQAARLLNTGRVTGELN